MRVAVLGLVRRPAGTTGVTPAVAASHDPPRRVGASARSHVLVVEDSPDHRMLITRALRGAGHEVTTAGSGEQALERLDGAHVDVALVDQRLPAMSGIDLLDRLASLPDPPACVIVTGAESQELVVEAMRRGAVDYVVKSSEYLSELPAVVARAHRQHDLARRSRELQRFALLVHEPAAHEDTVAEVVRSAHRLLRARSVALLRREGERGWRVTASEGPVPDAASLATLLERREAGTRPPGSGELVVDLPTATGDPVGALVVTAVEGAGFLDEEVDLAQAFAGFAASALRQARRLQLERTLVDELTRAVRAREDFLASVSHELRTPLTVIAGSVETLRHRADAVTPDVAGHLLDRVLGNADELRRLVDQLLDAASLQRGRRPLVEDPVDLRDVVAGALAELDLVLTARPGAREVPPVPVLVDPDLLRRALVNLLSNACKYSDDGTPVEVRADVRDDTVRIEVRDHGMGVPAAHREQVFEAFWRGPSAVAEAIRGTGIGLALVRQYADAWDGSVGVDPAPGGGSVFWVTAPRAEAVGGPAEPAGSLDDERIVP